MKKKISNYITKILICAIVTLGILIYAENNSKFQKGFKKYVLETNFNFMDFKSWYSSLTKYQEKEQDTYVLANEIVYNTKENYHNGVKYYTDKNTIINALADGIVVYKGEKESYGNVIIIQCSNGFDMWYGNVKETDLKMYDFVKNGKLLFESDDFFYLIITKNGKYYTYEEYLQNQ